MAKGKDCSSDASGADVLWLGSVDRSLNRQPVEGFDWPKSGAAETILVLLFWVLVAAT